LSSSLGAAEIEKSDHSEGKRLAFCKQIHEPDTGRFNMASITVRDIDAQSYSALKSRARRNKRSMAAEVRALIAGEGVATNIQDVVQDLRAFQDALRARRGEFSDSTAIIRAMREGE
jgi:plasmid stability protein